MLDQAKPTSEPFFFSSRPKTGKDEGKCGGRAPRRSSCDSRSRVRACEGCAARRAGRGSGAWWGVLAAARETRAWGDGIYPRKVPFPPTVRGRWRGSKSRSATVFLRNIFSLCGQWGKKIQDRQSKTDMPYKTFVISDTPRRWTCFCRPCLPNLAECTVSKFVLRRHARPETNCPPVENTRKTAVGPRPRALPRARALSSPSACPNLPRSTTPALTPPPRMGSFPSAPRCESRARGRGSGIGPRS